MCKIVWRLVTSILLLLGPLVLSLPGAQAQEITWLRQFGTVAGDEAHGVAVDGLGNIYVAGRTGGTLPGQTSAGGEDIFVRKYDSSGTVLWTRQFGSSTSDFAWGVAVDAASGAAYVVGRTSGFLPDQSSAGSIDAFVRKYDANGNAIWTHQFGTTATDQAFGVAVDGLGNIYVVGRTGGTLPGQTSVGSDDIFIRKYASDGTEVWTRQTGTANVDQASAVAADGTGNIWVAGVTAGTFPGHTQTGAGDAIVQKYDAGGNEVWTHQFGSSDFDTVLGVAVDELAGAVALAGWTLGALPGQTSAGGSDAFLRVYHADAGTVEWTRQFGTALGDRASGVAVDGSGDLYVSGEAGVLPGQTEAGFFVRSYDATGTERWTQQFAASNRQFSNPDEATGVAVDGASNVYVVGFTSGVLPSQTSAGHFDAFVARLIQDVDTIPPDTSIASAVDGNGMAITNAGSTVSTSLTLSFNGSDNVGVASFECSLDGVAFAPCVSPVSYSDLSIGDHSFHVRAIDEAGTADSTPASFTWSVLTPAEATENLIASIEEMSLPMGVESSLTSKLDTVVKKLSDSNPDNDAAACDSLDDFIAQVADFEASGKLSTTAAAELTQAAQAIKAAQGCL